MKNETTSLLASRATNVFYYRVILALSFHFLLFNGCSDKIQNSDEIQKPEPDHIILIPDDYPTIQMGIDIAEDGDTVLVERGSHKGNINFLGKAIVVTSNYLFTKDITDILETIISGDRNGRVVTFENQEDSTSVLSGFTLVNGVSAYGGGIGVFNFSDPRLEHLVISGNRAIYVGGGICVRGQSSPTIINTEIFGNTAADGGGIGIFFTPVIPLQMKTKIQNVIIRNNQAENGGGIYVQYGFPTLINVAIFRNRGLTSWPFVKRGGGIHLDHSQMSLENATITDNFALWGGGIYRAHPTEIPGEEDKQLSIINSILWGNSPQEIAFYSKDSSSINHVLSVSYSSIQEGESGILISGGNTKLSWGPGNINLDPLFCDEINNDYRIAENSPSAGSGQDGANMGAFGVGCEP